MRDSRSVAPAEAAAAPFAPAGSVPDGGLSAMHVLASAAHIARPGVASGSRWAPGAGLAPVGPAPVGRIELSGPTAVPQVHGATVTGAAGGRAGNHVGGAMLPPAANMVALSDGTRISFGAVAEVPEFADA